MQSIGGKHKNLDIGKVYPIIRNAVTQKFDVLSNQ